MTEKTEQRRLWDIQLEILDVIDQVCRENKLHYSLYAGSLLGAVRHQGFIPWDDDLDVCMPRQDYERFLEVWKNEDHPGFLIQNKRNTPSFTQSFSKIRKEHTTFLQYDWEKGRYHTGIFVDIFPIDRYPATFVGQKVFQWRCLKYQLYTREFVPPKASPIVKVISKLFLLMSSKSQRIKYRTEFENRLDILSEKTELHTVAVESTATMSHSLPPDLLDKYVYLPFEGRKYQCFAKWDEYLALKYGDYMQLPPTEERVWKHYHLIIDFDHNYGEES